MIKLLMNGVDLGRMTWMPCPPPGPTIVELEKFAGKIVCGVECTAASLQLVFDALTSGDRLPMVIQRGQIEHASFLGRVVEFSKGDYEIEMTVLICSSVDFTAGVPQPASIGKNHA